MALVAHTIVSRYAPPERELATETAISESDPWQTESSFTTAQRLHSRPAPHFVSAILEYNEYGIPKSTADTEIHSSRGSNTAKDVSTWYRALTSKGKAREDASKSKIILSRSTPSPISSPSSSSPHSLAGNQLPLGDALSPNPPTVMSKPTTPNWFTSCPLPSESPHSPCKPSTFSDLLSRNPPPLPSQPTFKPPLFLALGPSNRGFAMLERKGWREGEGLGSSRVERNLGAGYGMKNNPKETSQWKLDDECSNFQLQLPRTPKGFTDTAMQEVIDLTLSDDDDNIDKAVVDLTSPSSDFECTPDPEPNNPPPSSDPEHLPSTHGTTLLTPLATTLKADRLGIGVKRAHTSKSKAITHTSAALAAHIRSNNQMRKEKARHGRGNRGFARKRRNEEQKRLDLLSYMNT